MTDTISATEAADFIPEIWANTALQPLRDNIVIAQRVLSDGDVAAFTTGDTLNVPVAGTLSPSPKAANTAHVLAQPAGAGTVPVVLNKHYSTSFIIEDVVRATANQDLVARYGEAAGIGLAKQIETDLLTALQAASENYSSYATALTFDILLGAWKAMTDNLCPEGQRYVAASTKDIVSLVGDTDVQNWLAFSRGSQIAGDPNNLGAIAGFDGVLASQLIANTAGTPVETKNVAWRRDGVMLAMRSLPNPPANSGAAAYTMRDPESGLVFKVTISYSGDLGGARVTYEALYGVKILQQEKCLLLKA